MNIIYLSISLIIWLTALAFLILLSSLFTAIQEKEDRKGCYQLIVNLKSLD